MKKFTKLSQVIEKMLVTLVGFLLLCFPQNNIAQSEQIRLITPNGGENFILNTRQGISWVSENIEKVKISYSINDGKDWEIIENSITAEIGVVSWKVPNLINEEVLVKVEDLSGIYYDISNSYFNVISDFSNDKIPSGSLSINSSTVILPLGNSITYDNRASYNGTSPDSRQVGDRTGYRLPLYDLLTNAGYDFDFTGSEHAGGNFLPAGFDDNAGFPGISDDQLAVLLKTGRRFQPWHEIDEQITPGPYLDIYPADIILLHIGTNGNNSGGGTDPGDIEDILDEIKRYEDSTGTEITVLTSRIIDRSPNESYVTELNDNVEAMVMDRINNPANDAYPDKIVLVDMEDGAGINYTISEDPDGSPGDMNDSLHPNDNGYAKMAQLWFQAIINLLPGKPVITENPENKNIVFGESVSFNITAVGNPPLSYQWKKNGIDITGADSSTLVLNDVPATDDSSLITCMVSNLSSSELSEPAILYVASENERVTSGLELLYSFEENDGSNIFDKSLINPLLDLEIENISSSWVPYGLSLENQNSLTATSQPSKLYDALLSTNEITIETWILPSNISQTGPARIMTYSVDGSNRNFTLGQNGAEYIVRLRTTETDFNGQPQLSTSAAVVDTLLTQVIFTRDSLGVSKLYINGEPLATGNVGGDFSNWNSSYSFKLGDEFESIGTDRYWLGTYYFSSIYSRALRETEVFHNYQVGFNGINKFLQVPTNLSGIVQNDTTVNLIWEDNEIKELGYIIERRADQLDSTFMVLDTVNSNITTFSDLSPKHTTGYFYRVKAYNSIYESDYSDTILVNDIVSDLNISYIPTGYSLNQNYPNPFNPVTNISFNLPVQSQIEFEIFNILGQVVYRNAKKEFAPGLHSFNFDASNLSSGLYMYSIRAIGVNGKNYSNTKKMMLMK